MRRTLALALFLLGLAAACRAQMPVHHRCWDIDLAPQRSEPQPPYVVNAADSGLMLVAMAKEYLGTPYRYGGKTPKGFDCAGYARFLYLKFGHELPPYSGGQARVGTVVSDTRNLLPGDLVLFGGRHNTKAVGHTGIVVHADTVTGMFTFIHAAVHGGVIISHSTEPYYATRYLTARRVLR